MNDNVSNLLDMQLDDLADLPEFRPYPPGAHRCTLNFENKKVGTHPAIVIKLTCVETLELADTNESPLDKGATATVAYMLDNEYGQGAFKKVASQLKQHFSGANSLGEIIREAEGCEAIVVTKLRKDKNDATKFYTDIVELAVA